MRKSRLRGDSRRAGVPVPETWSLCPCAARNAREWVDYLVPTNRLSWSGDVVTFYDGTPEPVAIRLRALGGVLTKP